MSLLRRLTRRSGAGSPTLTVILTTYNHEAYIEQALHSVLDQKTRFPFRVVVIDDCSQDATREIVRRCASESRNVRLAFNDTNENSNRRFAAEWAECGSPYVAVLDGDDYWTATDKLQRQVDLLEARPECSICFHDALILEEAGGAEEQPYRFVGTDRAAVSRAALWTRCFVPGCSPVLRRTLAPGLPSWWVSGRDAGGWSHGDWALLLFLAQHGELAYIDEPLGVYRRHRDGLWSSRSPEEQRQDHVNVLTSMLEACPGQSELIHASLRNHQAAFVLERRWSLRRRAILSDRWDEDRRAAIDSLLSTHAPGNSLVVVPDAAVLSQRLSRRIASLARPAVESWQVFGRGPRGRKSAPWIAPGFAYEFRLTADGSVDEPQNSVTVVAAAMNESDEKLPADAPGEGVYIAASPNPAPVAGTHGTTEIEWFAGEAASVVVVGTYRLDAGLPEDGATAIRTLEGLRGRGAAFLLVPAGSLWWFELYPDFYAHVNDRYVLVADDAQAGRFYDLRR